MFQRITRICFRANKKYAVSQSAMPHVKHDSQKNKDAQFYFQKNQESVESDCSWRPILCSRLMNSSSDDEVNLVCPTASVLLKAKRNRKRKWWVKPWIERRKIYGAYNVLLSELDDLIAAIFVYFFLTRLIITWSNSASHWLTQLESRIVTPNFRTCSKSVNHRESLLKLTCFALCHIRNGENHRDFWIESQRITDFASSVA